MRRKVFSRLRSSFQKLLISFSSHMVYTVIWLKVTSARICWRDGTKGAFIGKHNDIIGSATGNELYKERGFCPCRGCLCNIILPFLSLSSSQENPHQPNKKSSLSRQSLIFMGTNPGIRCRNLRADFISISIVIMIFIMQKMRNVDICVIKYSVVHTVEVYNVSGSELNSNINSVPIASYFQTIGFPSIREELWMTMDFHCNLFLWMFQFYLLSSSRCEKYPPQSRR